MLPLGGASPFHPASARRARAIEAPFRIRESCGLPALSNLLIYLHDDALQDCCRYKIALGDYDYMTSDVGEWRQLSIRMAAARLFGKV